MAKIAESRAKNFLFRELRPNALIETASDRCAGWIGQIYSEGRYEKGITRRSHKVGDKIFNEETLLESSGDTILNYSFFAFGA
jgi:hypothetical protein